MHKYELLSFKIYGLKYILKYKREIIFYDKFNFVANILYRLECWRPGMYII